MSPLSFPTRSQMKNRMLKVLVVIFGLTSTTTTTNGFMFDMPKPSFCPTSTTTSTQLFAIGALAKKAKEAELRQLIETGLSSEILEKVKLMKSEKSSSTASSPGPVQLALTKRKGTISVVAEYKRRSTKSGYIKEEVLDADVLSSVFREFGASAVSVLADQRMGGCTYQDISLIKEEQATAKGDVPGPLPIINADLIVDELQLAMSADAGADAVLLQYSLLGEDPTKLAEFINYSSALGLECIVGVNTVEEAKSVASLSGVTMMLCTAFDVSDKVAMMTAAREAAGSAGDDRTLCILANIIPRDNKSLEEVEEAWLLRDKGFQGVWASDFLYKSGSDATEHAGAIIRSLKAKSSVKYASAKAQSGRGEGAREYLGDLLM